MPRPPRPDDLYRLRIPTQPALSPDGRWAIVTLQTVAPTSTGTATRCGSSRPTAADGEPRQLTIGARHDRHAALLARMAGRSRSCRTAALQVEEEPTRDQAGEGARGPGRRSTSCRSTGRARRVA